MEVTKEYEKYIGKRIKDEIKQRKGTVRWIGDLNLNNLEEISKVSEKWVGIEWDKAEDGTHRGEYKGKQYFQCISATSTASFLKFSKLNFGKSFLESLNEKYQFVETKTFREEKEERAFVYTVEGRKVEIEFVGEDDAKLKSSKYSHKLIISLPNFNISFSSNPSSHFPLFHQIKELDLSDNLISDWKEISKIIKEMKTLKSLNLSGNLIDFNSFDDQISFPPSMEILVLNRMNLSWLHINKIGEKSKGVREAHFSFNKFGNCDIKINIWPNLESFNFEGNFIENWENFSIAIGHFPLLSKINLSSNPISSLSLPLPFIHSFNENNLNNFNNNNNNNGNIIINIDNNNENELNNDNNIIINNDNNNIIDDNNNNNNIIINNNNNKEKNILFWGLKTIILTNTKISQWKSINCLHFYPNLKEVNISSIPLFNTNQNPISFYRLMTIARIGNLKILNRSIISNDERENSEKFYLSFLHNLTLNGNLQIRENDNSDEEFRHRMDFLLSVYGTPSDPIRSNRTQFIEVGIWSEFDGEVTKKLPANTTISKLKLIISRLFSVKANLLSLFFHKKKGELAIEPLDDEERTLEYYGVLTGGFIFVRYPFKAAKNKKVDPFEPVVI